MTDQNNPTVSVIVPARNEEACLSFCLQSLVTQTGIEFEIIVVDDASTDRTAEIACSFTMEKRKSTTSGRADAESNAIHGTAEKPALSLPKGRALPTSSTTRGNCECLRVIPAGPLPDNWTGKNNALSAGAKIAKGKWLLFTDADTDHKPGLLARAVAEAEQHGAALLSYSPEQEVHTFCERAVMPVIFAELAATYPPKKVNDPASPIAAANGQYLLISREAYDAVGGHAKIAGDLLEDVAMARLVKSSGRKIFFRYGGDAVRTRMYRTWPQMKEGWTKNLALLFRANVKLAWNVGFSYFMTVGGSLCIAILIIGQAPHPTPPLIGLLFAAFPLVTWLRIRKAHFPWVTTTIALYFGQPMFLYLLLRSKSRIKNGGITWKDREYLPSSLHGDTWKRDAIGTGE